MNSRVALVISAFKADASVIRLLEAAQACVAPPWSEICVVDSLASGAVVEHLRARRWTNVDYQSYDRNLGSAGNLAARLLWAAARGYDFAYAINHDSTVDPEVVRGLVHAASARVHQGARLGATYPLRRYVGRGHRYDLTGTTRWPLPFHGTQHRPTEPFRVTWASSNGALYAMAPLREGLSPWSDFWMGWEDLAYGWLLDDAGFEQWVETSVVFDDDYETREVVQGVVVTEKPFWYAYYQTRNLLLASARTQQSLAARGLLAARFAMEGMVTVVVRREKVQRLRLLAQGILDGLRGVAGKGPVP